MICFRLLLALYLIISIYLAYGVASILIGVYDYLSLSYSPSSVGNEGLIYTDAGSFSGSTDMQSHFGVTVATCNSSGYFLVSTPFSRPYTLLSSGFTPVLVDSCGQLYTYDPPSRYFYSFIVSFLLVFVHPLVACSFLIVYANYRTNFSAVSRL